MILADDLICGETLVMKQMIDLYNHYQSSVLGVMNVRPDTTDQYGIVASINWL